MQHQQLMTLLVAMQRRMVDCENFAPLISHVTIFDWLATTHDVSLVQKLLNVRNARKW